MFAIVVWVLKLSEEASSLQRNTQMIVCGHCPLKAEASMHAGLNDHRICTVSGHEHLHSLKVYDHQTMSAACDKTRAINTLVKASDRSSTTASRSAGIIHIYGKGECPSYVKHCLQ